jgi:hypothetical protein
MNEDRRRHDELLLALDALEPDDLAEARAEAAARALFRQGARPAPRAGFRARVMDAISQAALPAGRRRLARRPSFLSVAAVSAAVAAAGIGFLVFLFPAVGPLPARAAALAVETALVFVTSASVGINLWELGATVARAATAVAIAPDVLSLLAGITAIGALSFAVLTRLLDPQQESVQW